MAKWFSVALVLAIAYFFWRQQHPRTPRERKAPPPVNSLMKPCTVCGVLCPNSDMLPGKKGMYCSSQHHAQGES